MSLLSKITGGLFSSGGGAPKMTGWQPQLNALSSLYGQAGTAGTGYSQFLQSGLPSLYNPGLAGYGTLGMFSQVGNPAFQGQAQDLQNRLGNFFSENILTGMNDAYNAGGISPGSSRWRVQAEQQGGLLGRELASGLNNLYDQSNRLAFGSAVAMPGVASGLQGLAGNAFMSPWESLANIYGTAPSMSSGTKNPGLLYSGLNSFMGGFGQGLGGIF